MVPRAGHGGVHPRDQDREQARLPDQLLERARGVCGDRPAALFGGGLVGAHEPRGSAGRRGASNCRPDYVADDLRPVRRAGRDHARRLLRPRPRSPAQARDGADRRRRLGAPLPCGRAARCARPRPHQPSGAARGWRARADHPRGLCRGRPRPGRDRPGRPCGQPAEVAADLTAGSDGGRGREPAHGRRHRPRRGTGRRALRSLGGVQEPRGCREE